MYGLLAYAALAVVSTGVVRKGSVLLELSAERVNEHDGLPVAVHGAAVVAVGSSFPERGFRGGKIRGPRDRS